jgi:hypothetical protein
MLKQKTVRQTCPICSQPVINYNYDSTISHRPLMISVCSNKHMSESFIEFEEVCPYCESSAIMVCNCIQQTKNCINGHSWLVCKYCKSVTKSEVDKHIVYCEKCKK